MQEWQKLGAEYVASKHDAKSVYYVQQQSKVCIQTFALLYIAAFLCIPNCLGTMSQLITGDYVIKFGGIALEFSCQRGV